ncbi:unnamed protein product [Phytophthora lilii]|uniref:Unnamed protein product n=1 Tax=Phytophthora lilii TaxID=2077276 RepID=A0A9W6TQM9_9STRA|nr:unnamed protein product [Phytophthora lilii]
MAFSLEDEDDQAFQAALSFVDECVLDEEEVEDASALRTTALMQREDEWAALSGGLKPTVNITGVETSFGAHGGYETTSMVSATPSKAHGTGGSGRDKLRRRTEINERKKLLRKAGIYGDANWMSKDSRLEIAYLHERIEKLQLDLQVLQSRKSRQPAIKTAPEEPTTDSALQVPKVWKEIACRQQRRLKEAERENARLKLAVQRQQKVANCMNNLVRKRASHLTNDCSSFMDVDFSNQRIVQVLSSRGGAGDFPLLFRHLETAHQEVDAVFLSNGLANMVLTPSDVHIREGVDGKYLEAFSNKVLPFGLREATEATWDHFKGSEKHRGNGSIYQKTAKASARHSKECTRCTPFCKGNSNCANAFAAVSTEPRRPQLVRRYMEPDRDIVIWVSVAEPAEIKHKMLRGLTYHLRGYAMTKRSPASTPEHQVSQLQCVSLISLEPEAEAMYGSETVRAVTNFLIVTAAQKMQAHQDRIENALVDRALRRQGVATAIIPMVFFLEDDDRVVEAALSFVDECSADGAAAEDAAAPSRAKSPPASEDDWASTSCSSSETTTDKVPVVQSARCKAPLRLTSREEKIRRRKEINKKTRILRKAGVYADSNRVRNGRTREIAFLREQMEKLQIDLETLKKQKGKHSSTCTEAGQTQQRDAAQTSRNPKMWQAVLDIQRRRREEAENENIRLKLIVERQRRVADSMSSMLQKRASGLPYTIVEEFTKELFSRSSHADIKVKQVIRRYVEPDRDIVIWVARVSPAEIKHKMLSGLTYQHRGYAVTKRSAASTPDHEVSQLQCCSMISIDPEAETSPRGNVPSQIQGDPLEASAASTSASATRAARRNAQAKPSLSSEEKRRRQQEINERRRLLRRAGIYGDSNRVRNERTREIAFLRGQIEKLQLDLQLLQSRQAREQRGGKQTNTTALITRDSSSMHTIWKEQAVRQRRRREETERDNVRLRLAVERQKKVASSLQGLMQKRSSQLLFCRLDSAYREIDAVFAANGLATMAVFPDDVHVRDSGKYLEFFTYKDLPFDLQETTEAAWDHFKGVEKHLGYGSLYQKTAKNLDEPYTIIEDFSKEVYSNSLCADVKVKQVVRRYVEPDRDIVIWVSHSTPVEVKHKMLRGLSYNFRGYAITRRSPSSTAGDELTQLQLCSLISLDQDENTKYGADNARALTNFLIVHAAKNILSHRESIENSLADRALRQIDASRAQPGRLTPSMAFLLEGDDGQAFEAALSFVDEFKLDEAADEMSTAEGCRVRRGAVHPSRDEDPLTKRARANARKKLLRQAGIYSDPNRARNERTREIAFLREQIEKLQLDLKVLQGRETQEQTGATHIKDAALVTRNSKSQISSMWQEQAARQQRRREEAERDNVRLRLAVERQRKVANSLKALMKKRSNQLLFQRVDDAYRDVDAVFKANGLERSTMAPGDVHMRELVDGKYLEFSTYKVLPYEMKAATEAVWEHFKGVEKHLGVGNIYEKAAKVCFSFLGHEKLSLALLLHLWMVLCVNEQNLDEPYTIIEDFSLEIYSNNARADFKTKQVVRRYVEPDRDIVIWVSHATPVEVKHKLLCGLAYNFLGYAITKRSSSSSAGHELTRLQLCSRTWLDQDSETTHTSDSARTLANFLIVHAAKNIVAHRESIENTLADRVLSPRLHYAESVIQEVRSLILPQTASMAAFLENDDDERVVNAALSFIDEFELRALESTGISTRVNAERNAQTDPPVVPPKNEAQTSTFNTSDAQTDKKARRRAAINERKRLLRKAGIYGDPNRARNAQTREIAFLRDQLEKLTLDLKVLERQKTRSPKVFTNELVTMNSTTQIPSMWQKLAERQRHRRQEAESTNLRLKLAVERHHKLASDLSSLASRRASELTNECEYLLDLGHFAHPSHHIVRALNFSARDNEFLGLLQHLDSAYRDMDAIFAANGLTSMAMTPADVQMRESVKGRYRYLEFFSYNILPFEFQATAEATWEYFRGVKKHLGYGNLYEKAAKDLDEPYTIIEDFTKELYSHSSRADIRIKQAIRRYVEPDRDIVVRFYRAVPVEIKHKLLSRLTYHLQGYAVTARAPTSTPEHELSVLQLCTLVSFDQVEVEAVCDPFSLHAFTAFLIAHTAQNTRSHCEIIQNALADQVIAQQVQ